MRLLMAMGMLLLLIIGPGCSGREEGPAVELKSVPFATVQEKLAAWRGKVVVVDFWAYY